MSPATDRPLTQAEWFGALAEESWSRGQAELERGDAAAARAWLERAHRIAPDDLTVALSLAAARLPVSSRGAAKLFERVADRIDLAEALIGLAGARLVSGDSAGAGDALQRLLSRHVQMPNQPPAALLRSVVRLIGAPGWCWVDEAGMLRAELLATGRLALATERGERPIRVPLRIPRTAARLVVQLDGRKLLGSPIDLSAIRRVDGFVRTSGRDLEGWAWYPAAPNAIPEIIVRYAGGGEPIRVRAETVIAAPSRPFARPRAFRVSADALPGAGGLLHVLGPDGRELPGSPLDPGAEARAAVAIARSVASGGDVPAVAAAMLPIAAGLQGPPAAAPLALDRRVAVVIPVYRGVETTRRCLETVFATVPERTLVIVVDDGGSEPELANMLDAFCAARRITVIRNKRNLGFPAAANIGLRAATGGRPLRDVVLLNSDTLVTRGWIERLRAAVHAASDIGTATPLSNDASILSYPRPDGGNALPERTALRRIAALAARANANVTVDIPTAVGFCMYIRRECIDDVGLFREDAFAQGYGEENDFCIRARHLGWRHVAVPSAYVAHVGGQSFGDARVHLMARNLDVLERLHPGYHALIAAWQHGDPLADARRRLDRRRWAAGRLAGGAVVLISHDSGGGVERVVRQRCREIAEAGQRAIVIRPIVDRERPAREGSDRRYLPGFCRIDDGVTGDYPNLRYRLPDELPEIAALLRGDRAGAVELHHTLGQHPILLDLARVLGVPYDVVVHDYALLCPRISLIGSERRYCGEPTDVAICDACVADAGSAIEEEIDVATLRTRSAGLLAGARRVTVPSTDTAARLRRHFPAVRPEVVMHEDDARLPPLARIPAGPRRVCVVGGIGIEKGYDVLLACARDAAARRLPLEFVVVGHTVDDRRLLATGTAFVTGPYKDEDAVALVREQQASLGFLPSIWPETWCYTLQHLWQAGLAVAAFDIGAIAERIRRNRRGWLFPLGIPAAAVNNALLAVQANASDEWTATRLTPTRMA